MSERARERERTARTVRGELHCQLELEASRRGRTPEKASDCSSFG